MQHREPNLEETIEREVQAEVKEFKREWRHLIKFKNENHLLVLAFFVILTCLVVINGIYILKLSAAKKAPPTYVPVAANVHKTLTSLQTAKTAELTAHVSNVTENDKTDYAFASEPGTTMLIMDFTIKNNTKITQNFIPVSQLYVRSNEGDMAALHASMYVTKPISADELKPGQSATGQISFSVPKTVAHPLLYVDTMWNDSTPIVFDVLK